jgi:hypothetical protein
MSSIVSDNGCFLLMMQTDGNLVLYYLVGQTRQPLWATRPYIRSMTKAVMQSDGNLVLYDSKNSPGWNSKTNNNPGAYLKIEDTGDLVIYSSSKTQLWHSNTKGQCPGSYIFFV